MKKIVPHLWFNKEAMEAAEFYIDLFEGSEILSKQQLEDTPSGDVLSVSYELAGQPFMAINGGPHFTFNPSVSLTVLCDSKQEINQLWDAFIVGGRALMPLQKYPFSELYGWVEDKFGVSWQLISSEGQDYAQKIVPTLLFSGEVTGKAQEAMEFYTDIFQDGEMGDLFAYQEGDSNNPKAKIAHGTFKLMETEFVAMDNGEAVDYSFNEAFSILVNCVTQAEIDYYWENLSAVPEAEQCGWLKDKYGLSWQITPIQMNELLENGTRGQINRVTQTFLKMKKLDIAKLEQAWQEVE